MYLRYNRARITVDRGVMVNMLASSVVDRGVIVNMLDSSVVDRVKPRAIHLVFATYLLTTQLQAAKANTGWLGVSIIYPSGVTSLPADCCFSEL
jgi:hypothetical protein